VVTRGLIAGLLFPLSFCAWAWEEEQVLEFVTAYNPLIRAHQAVTKEYAPSNTARWLMEQGIESLSLNPDTVVSTWLSLAE
jgi:hypothetical protein